MLISIDLYLFNVCTARLEIMHICPRQLVVCCGELCLFVWCGTSKLASILNAELALITKHLKYRLRINRCNDYDRFAFYILTIKKRCYRCVIYNFFYNFSAQCNKNIPNGRLHISTNASRMVKLQYLARKVLVLKGILNYLQIRQNQRQVFQLTIQDKLPCRLMYLTPQNHNSHKCQHNQTNHFHTLNHHRRNKDQYRNQDG